MKHQVCAKCRCEFGIPDELYTAARASPAISFYCPYGHGLCFPAGESIEDKLRRECDRLAQQVAQRDDEIRRQREHADAERLSASAACGQVTKLKNRAASGVCPCCNRWFANLARHMASQHPTFKAEAVAT